MNRIIIESSTRKWQSTLHEVFWPKHNTNMEFKKQQGKNIYCDGGAEIVSLLMKNDLIDEFIISIIPILLGNCISLFKGKNSAITLKTIGSKHVESGLVQIQYKI